MARVQPALSSPRAGSTQPFLRAAGFAVVGLAASLTYAACGFDAVGAAPGSPGSEAAAPSSPTASDASTGDASDGGGFESPCTTERTVCSGVCTDTTSDPANCSACGKACLAGESCLAGVCEVLCLAGTTACGGSCVDTKTSPSNCGKCGQACAGATPFCVGGTCVPDCGTASLCPGNTTTAPSYCANLATDVKNCGICGRTCAANETCTGTPAACKALCAPGSLPGDVLAPNMVGCTGKVSYANAAALCPAGTSVCTPGQFVTRGAGRKPTYHYWTSEYLGHEGSPGNCSVAPVGTFGYSGCNNPMRVCAGSTDPLGNQCNGVGCGYKTRTNQYFGGCTNNTTAGSLCCSP